MNPRSVRLPPALQAEADHYAEGLGISFNALVAVALREYLDARPIRSPGRVAFDTGERAAAAAAGRAGAQTVAAVAASVPRVGVNEPCPCGSRQKYKRCCGRPGGAP